MRENRSTGRNNGIINFTTETLEAECAEKFPISDNKILMEY